MGDYFGYHLMLDCSGCNENIASAGQIKNFIEELVPAIDMIAHGKPLIEFMLPGDPKQGFSMVQLIETSNVCAHFIEPDSTAYLDVFSCKNFDIKVAEDVFRKYFEPTKVRVNFITRHAG